MDKLNPEIRKEIFIKVVSRAWKDPEFKKRLLANPKTALKEMHLPIPENIEIKVVEEEKKMARDDKNIFTIVIPQQPVDVHKLSENDLAALAGGYEFIIQLPSSPAHFNC
jgi:hypothetical protein